MKIQWLLSLFLALPALAAEPAAPTGDPGLAALEQEILDSKLAEPAWGQWLYDWNGNGRCDPEERPLLLYRLKLQLGLEGRKTLEPAELVAMALATGEDSNGKPYWVVRLMMEVASSYDLDHDGKLSLAEAREMLATEKLLEQEVFIDQQCGNGRSLYLNAEDFTEGNVRRQRILTDLLRADDKNGNGRLDPEEAARQRLANAGMETVPGELWSSKADLDGDGRASLAERQAFLNLYAGELDLDGDGIATPADIRKLAYLRGYPLNTQIQLLRDSPVFLPKVIAPWNAWFDAQYLPKFDTNHNGRWEIGELQDPALRRAVASGQFHPYFHELSKERQEADANHNDVVEPAEQEAMLQRLLKTRDWNHDGRLEADEESFDSPVSRLGLAPAAAVALYDADGDGKLSMAELRIASFLGTALAASPKQPNNSEFLQRCLSLYDENHDGRWDELEAARCADGELAWKNYAEIHSLTDADGHPRWLDAEERQAAIEKLPSWFDADRDGAISLTELETSMRFFLSLQFCGTAPEATPEMKQRLFRLLDTNRDDRISIDEVDAAWQLRVLMLAYFREADTNKNGLLDVCLDEADNLLGQLLKDFDENHNGRMESVEILRAYTWHWQMKTIMFEYFRALGEKKLRRSWPELMKERGPEFLAFADANGDGRLDFVELMQAQAYVRTLEIALNQFGEGGALAGRAQLSEWTKRYDANHNGKLDADELTWLVGFRGFIRTLEVASYDFQLDTVHDDFRKADEDRTLEAYFLKNYDSNHNGMMDPEEQARFYRDQRDRLANVYELVQKRNAKGLVQAQKEAEEKQVRQEADWLKQYDLNGNGQLDPEERKRAEKETQAGLKSPALEE